MKLLTYYTADSPYVADAEKLRASAERFGLEITLEAVPDEGAWERNCARKAEIVRKHLARAKEPLLFLDADCFLKGPLDAFEDLPEATVTAQIVNVDDVRPGFHCLRYRYHMHRRGGMINSGVMLWRPGKTARKLADNWVAWCRRRPHEWDQINLQFAAQDTAGVSIRALPGDLRAGGPVVAHESGFHRHWNKNARRVRRSVLLLGSAPDVPAWWARHGDECINAGFAITALNNAWRVPALTELEYWFHPDDFEGDRPPGMIPRNEDLSKEVYDGRLNRGRNWLIRPAWGANNVHLSFVDALYHLANEAVFDKVDLTVHVAGCDMVYEGDRTHFYGNGTPDPLRYSDTQLERALADVKSAYEDLGFTLVNASDADATRLPFERMNGRKAAPPPARTSRATERHTTVHVDDVRLGVSSFSELKGRHQGERVWIFGTGPSLDLVKLENVKGPRILLHRAAFAVPHAANETYWLVLDDCWGMGTPGPWAETLDCVRDGSARMLLVAKDPLGSDRGRHVPAPEGPNIVRFNGTPEICKAALGCTREQLEARETLWTWCGSAAPAVHLAWFMGAREVTLVGCDGCDGHAEILARYYGGGAGPRGGFGYVPAHDCMMQALTALEINHNTLCEEARR